MLPFLYCWFDLSLMDSSASVILNEFIYLLMKKKVLQSSNARNMLNWDQYSVFILVRNSLGKYEQTELKKWS